MKDSTDTWLIPAIAVHLPDGSTLVKPGKAIQRSTLSRTIKLTGIERKTLHALADAGYIRRQRPSRASAFFFPAEIEEFLVKTEDPTFWEVVKKRAGLHGKTLKSSVPK